MIGAGRFGPNVVVQSTPVARARAGGKRNDAFDRNSVATANKQSCHPERSPVKDLHFALKRMRRRKNKCRSFTGERSG